MVGARAEQLELKNTAGKPDSGRKRKFGYVGGAKKQGSGADGGDWDSFRQVRLGILRVLHLPFPCVQPIR